MVCPYDICDGDGWVFVPNATGADDAERCRCMAERAGRRRIHRALRAVPEGFHSVSWERQPIVDCPIRPQLRSYVNGLGENLERGRGLWLVGASGAGKTSAAALIVKEASTGYACAIWNGQKLIDRIKQLIRPDAPMSTYDFVEQLLELDLLVLDDLGAVNATDYALETLYTIINDRYEHLRSLIVTTDLDVYDLEARLGTHGPRIVRRLGDMCGAPLSMPHLTAV